MTAIARTIINHARRPALAGLMMALLVCVSGCVDGGAEVDAQPSASPTPEVTAQSTSLPGTPSESAPSPSSTAFLRPTSVISPTAPAPPDVPYVVEKVIAQAADEYAVGRERVNLISYEEATWPSTALGCTEEGRFYAQIVTSGFTVTLGIDGRTVVYHVDERGMALVNCGEADALRP